MLTVKEYNKLINQAQVQEQELRLQFWSGVCFFLCLAAMFGEVVETETQIKNQSSAYTWSAMALSFNEGLFQWNL